MGWFTGSGATEVSLDPTGWPTVASSRSRNVGTSSPPAASRLTCYHLTPRLLSAGALAVRAPWPAAGPTLAFLQLLLGPANATFSGQFLLGILDPANELVAGQRRDVLPGIECRGVGGQRLAQVCRKLVHHPTGHSAAHRATVVKRANPRSLGPHQWVHAEN